MQVDVQAGDWKVAHNKWTSGQEIQAQPSIASPAGDSLRAYQSSLSVSMKNGGQRGQQPADADSPPSESALEQLQKKLEVRVGSMVNWQITS